MCVCLVDAASAAIRAARVSRRCGGGLGSFARLEIVELVWAVRGVLAGARRRGSGRHGRIGTSDRVVSPSSSRVSGPGAHRRGACGRVTPRRPFEALCQRLHLVRDLGGRASRGGRRCSARGCPRRRFRGRACAVSYGLSLPRRGHVCVYVRVLGRRRGSVVLGGARSACGVGGVVVLGRGSQSVVGMVQRCRLQPARDRDAGVECIFMRVFRLHLP